MHVSDVTRLTAVDYLWRCPYLPQIISYHLSYILAAILPMSDFTIFLAYKSDHSGVVSQACKSQYT
jgi:hypothetical protein